VLEVAKHLREAGEGAHSCRTSRRRQVRPVYPEHTQQTVVVAHQIHGPMATKHERAPVFEVGLQIRNGRALPKDMIQTRDDTV
jgi:hypothetical protein